MRLKVGYEQAKAVQGFQSLALVASQIFGGGKKSSDIPEVTNNEELKAHMARLFGGNDA